MGRILIEKLCERCNAPFGARKDAITKGYGRFCSQHCHQKFGWPDTCTAPGCNLPHAAKGFCKSHYARLPEVRARDREQLRVWYRDPKNQEKGRQYARKSYYKIKELTLSHYSNAEMKCAACGLADTRVLDIDHIDNNGGVHRREIHSNGKNSGIWIYHLLRREGFPAGYQVLCRNCNFIKYLEAKKERRVD